MGVVYSALIVRMYLYVTLGRLLVADINQATPDWLLCISRPVQGLLLAFSYCQPTRT